MNLNKSAILCVLSLFLLSVLFTGLVASIADNRAFAAVVAAGEEEPSKPPAPPQTTQTPVPRPTITPPPIQQPAQPTNPLSVTGIQMRNEDKDGNALSDFKISFDYDEARYISYYITLTNNTNDRLKGKLGVKFIGPDGSLRRNSQSPVGFTYDDEVDVQKTLDTSGGWGHVDGGTFVPGRHQIEFWWAGQKIYQTTFAINAPESGWLTISNIRLRNETKDDKPLSGFTNRYRRADIRYLTYYITVTNEGGDPVTGKLGVKFIGPDGTLARNAKSPDDYTFEDTISIDQKSDHTNGYGNNEGNVFDIGKNSIEFWWNGRKIGSTTFEVY